MYGKQVLVGRYFVNDVWLNVVSLRRLTSFRWWRCDVRHLNDDATPNDFLLKPI